MSLVAFPRQIMVDADGVPRVGCLAYFYLPTTTTPITIYTTAAYAVELTNPVTSVSGGYFPAVYINSAVNATYKLVVKDSLGATLYTEDNIPTPMNGSADILALVRANTFTYQIISYDRTDAETAALVTPTNYYRKPGDVQRYGTNTVPGTTDMTTAMTAAIAQSIQPGGAPVFLSTCSGGSGTTANDYVVNSAINITGPVMFIGESDRLSYHGARIVKTNNAAGTAAQASIFTVTGNQAIALTFENVGFGYTGASAITGAAFIYVVPSGAGPNSFYFRGCWFFTPMFYAISVSSCDDVKIIDCTFDVSAQRWLNVGGSGQVTNFSCIGCTFYNQAALGYIDVINVKNFIFEGNRNYWDGSHQISYGIDLQTNSVANVDVLINDNTWEGFNQIVKVSSTTSKLSFSDNIASGVANAPAIAIGGGVAVTKLSITDNILSGYAGASGMIDVTGTPLTNSIIKDNIIECNVGGTSAYGVNAPSGSNTGDIISDNAIIGATTDYNIGAPSANQLSLKGSWTPTIAGSTTAGTHTYNTQVGKYKVYGNICYIEGQIAINVKDAAMAGNVQINGLPFSIGTTYASLTCGYKAALTLTNARINLFGAAGNNFINIMSDAAAVDSANAVAANVANGTTINFSGFYFLD